MNRLKFDLQHFAEGEENTPEVEKPKTFTQEEVDAQINAVVGKERARSDKALKDVQDQLQELKQEQNLAGLNEQEKMQKELEIEKQKREALEKEISATQIKNEALGIFSERNLPAALVDFMLCNTAEETLDRINKFESEFKKVVDSTVQATVDERLKGAPPATSKVNGNVSDNPFLTGNVTAQMQLMKTNPELATQLKDVADKAKK